MGLPEPETQGHASAQGARVAAERGDLHGAITTHLAGGMEWTADMLVSMEERIIALEKAAPLGYEPPEPRERSD
jgi:hypothetical protein